MHACILRMSSVITSMYETKKGGETSKLRRGKANMHRKEDSNCWDMQPR